MIVRVVRGQQMFQRIQVKSSVNRANQHRGVYVNKPATAMHEQQNSFKAAASQLLNEMLKALRWHEKGLVTGSRQKSQCQCICVSP